MQPGRLQLCRAVTVSRLTALFEATMSHLRICISAIVACAFATGCSSLNKHSSFHEVSSEPSLPTIELLKPAIVTDQGATTTFPPGKYKPAYQDEGGSYFEAPRKVLVDDIGVYGFDGGVYVPRGKTAPSEWYIIRPNGRRSMGHFKTLPVYKEIH